MREAIIVYAPWLLSLLGIAVTIFVGNKVRWAWGFTMAVQCLWIAWALALPSWGLLPLLLFQFGMQIHYHRIWMREDCPRSTVAVRRFGKAEVDGSIPSVGTISQGTQC